MSEIVRQPFPGHPFPGAAKPPASTQADDGMPRRDWTGEEVQRMIGGDLVAMIAKGNHHVTLKVSLQNFWGKARSDDVRVASETPLRLATSNETEPEFIVYPRGMKPGEVRGDTVLLVVEVADTSLPVDHDVKAPLYARFGVREYWVNNARSLITTIYREPTSAGYG